MRHPLDSRSFTMGIAVMVIFQTVHLLVIVAASVKLAKQVHVDGNIIMQQKASAHVQSRYSIFSDIYKTKTRDVRTDGHSFATLMGK